LADVRKRTGPKGTTYQVRYPSQTAKSDYAYATFDTMKQARAFSENLGAVKEAPTATRLEVSDAVDRWLEICEKVGRDGRETVEPETLKEYKRRAKVMKRYKWPKQLHALEPPDVVQFRTWLLGRHFSAVLVCHGPNGRKWFTRSPDIPDRWFPQDTLDPESFAFGVLFGKQPNDAIPRRIPADAWFDRSEAQRYEVHEQTIQTGSEEILTLVLFRDPKMLEEWNTRLSYTRKR
jgi:hypothetical protein